MTVAHNYNRNDNYYHFGFGRIIDWIFYLLVGWFIVVWAMNWPGYFAVVVVILAALYVYARTRRGDRVRRWSRRR